MFTRVLHLRRRRASRKTNWHTPDTMVMCFKRSEPCFMPYSASARSELAIWAEISLKHKTVTHPQPTRYPRHPLASPELAPRVDKLTTD